MQRIAQVFALREKGASAIIVAICLLVLVGFGALSVDVGALWSDKKQLQNGADAGAIAIAQACAESVTSPECIMGDPTVEDNHPTAASFADSNKLDTNASGSVIGLVTSGAEPHVTVRTRSVRQLWFAGVLNVTSAPVVAEATASWEAMGGGTTLPLAMPDCIFDEDALDDASAWMRLIVKAPSMPSATDPCGAPGPSSNIVPGGFHWLDPTDGTTCTVTTDAGDMAPGKTGGQPPPPSSSCPPEKLQAALLAGEVLIPIYDAWNELGGANAQFHLVGYAAFEPTAWCLKPPNTVAYNTSTCNSSELWIEGYFVKKVPLGDAPSNPLAEDFGVKTVKLSG